MNDLKCPFCGSKYGIHTSINEQGITMYKAVCKNINCPTESWNYYTEQEARDWWNTRAAIDKQ